MKFHVAQLLALISLTTVTSCATFPVMPLGSGRVTTEVKNLIADVNGKSNSQQFSAHAINTGRNMFGQRTYTTTSVMSGTIPLTSKPNILVSDTDKNGIHLRFYTNKNSNDLHLQTLKFSRKYIDVLAAEKIRKWSAKPVYTFTYNIYLIGWKERVDGQFTRIFRDNNLESSFYARALPIEKGDFLLAKTLAHETFHLMYDFFSNRRQWDLAIHSKGQRLMIEEAAANIFGFCSGLKVNNQVNLISNTINTITNEKNESDIRKGSLDDRWLEQFLKPRFKIDPDYARVIFGPMIFTTLWAEYAGQAEVIKAGDPAAKKFMDLCENHIWPPEKLIPVLQEMASDGIDPPQLRVKGEKALKPVN